MQAMQKRAKRIGQQKAIFFFTKPKYNPASSLLFSFEADPT